MMARAVRFDLVADASRFTRGMRQAERSTKSFTQHTSRAGSAVKTAFAAFSAGAVVFEINKWVAAARDANKVAAQTNAVITSTGGAAGLSAKGFADLAKQISKTAAVDDDLIQGGENILATFTAIKAGGPDKIFERATQAAVDMTAAMNGGQVSAEGLKSANLVLGKALQDPIAGLGKLQRVGVSFNDQQKEQIKTWVEHGEVAKAQGLILAEVNKEFGGSAEAAATPAQKLAVAWGDMQEVLGNLLIPAIDKAAVVMTDVLGVVDKNRTAFGILFGVLAGGAAVIGALIVAEKVHRAVVDATKVATAAWATIQKGMNIILGTTAAQAGAATVAEEGLTVATTTSGAAAKGSAASFKLLAGSLGLLTAGIGLGVFSVKTWIDTVKKGTSENEKFGGTVQLGTKFGGLYAQSMDKAGTATKKSAEETNNAAAAQQLAKDKAAALNTAIDAQTAKLKPLKDAFKQQTTAVGDTIKAYDGLITQSDVTTGQVIGDLHNQVSNFKTYSKDVKRLIKEGVSPAAIQELSQKGPQYIHALAEGSNAQLKKYKGYWHDRQAEVKGSFAASMKLQYDDLVKKIQAMQKEINKLKGKTVSVGAVAHISLEQKTKAALLAMGIKGYGTKFLAEGGMTRLGQTAIVGEEGPELVQFQQPARVYSAKETRGILGRGMADGGIVGGFGQPSVEFARQLGQVAGNRIAAVAGSRLAAIIRGQAAGGMLGGQSGAGGWQWQMRVLRAAFPGLELISGYRTRYFTATGGHSYHNMGRAVDVPPRMDVFNWIRGNYGKNTKELIFSPAGNRQIHNGQPHMYTGVTRADHWNHVHWAYDKGGWLPPGTSLVTNNTGRPERVLAPGGDVIDYRRLARAIVDALTERPPVVRVDDVHAGLLAKQRRVAVGLGLH